MRSRAIKVLCIGTLIVDIINDAIDRMLNAGEAVHTTIGVHLGGNAYNVAVDLVKLGLPAEGKVGCVGAVGNDFFGELYQRELKEHGVIPQVHTAPGKSTSKNVILQAKGEERRYHFDEGANTYLDFGFTIDTIRTFRPDVLYIGEIGSLGETGQRLRELLETAKGFSCLTVVDAIITPGEDWGYLHRAAGLIDILHCNDHEARSITGSTETEETIEKLLGLSIPLPIVSQGDGELLCGYHGYRYSIPAFKVVSADPTGAGDAFTAGLIRKLVEFAGSTLEEKLGATSSNLLGAILFGEAAGASCVTALGCTAAVDETNVLELLDDQAEDVLSNVASRRL